MPQLIRVRGIEARGRHGASEGERDAPQVFRVDLDIVVQADADELSSTADYRELVAAARRVIEGGSHAIIETIAERIAEEAAGVPGVLTARVVVHKPAAATRLEVNDISAEATAGRIGR